MARMNRSTHRAGTTAPPEELPDLLRRRARRLARDGKYRKAAVALQRLAAHTRQARDFVLLGDMLLRARRPVEAVLALRQGLYLHRQAGATARARTVARLLARMDMTAPVRAA